MRSRPIYYVLLAAGLSRRFPGNKLLADICGRPVVRASAEVAVSAGLPLAVVTGNDRDSIVRALEGLDFHEVENPAYASGLSSSVRAAISALREQADAIELAPADMPLIPPAVPRLLAEIREDSSAPLIAPRYGGSRGHPVLLGRELYDDASSSVRGDRGLSDYMSLRAELLLEVDVGYPGVLLDVDTLEDLERLRSIAGCGRPRRHDYNFPFPAAPVDAEAIIDPLERALRWAQSAATGRPYNFSWFRDRSLAASGIPATRRSAQWLAREGIESVLTLTEWVPGSLLGSGFLIKHVPMRNGKPAPRERLREAVDFLVEQLGMGRRSLVHCLSGRGRTGMVLAAYLVVAEGYGASDAVREVSALRPGSLRNRRQVRSVLEFGASLGRP
ncbi:MAG: NTP transferase domain-containing protein [Conexivisphaera sp.]